MNHLSNFLLIFLKMRLETHFKNLAAERPIKLGELLLAFRIMLVGGKFGPGVFEIVEAIELKDAMQRIRTSLSLLSTN